MKSRAGFALLLAGALGSSASPIVEAAAQDTPVRDAVCNYAAVEMFKAILEARGVPEWAINAGDGTHEAWSAYLQSPDDRKLDAVATSITKSALSALVPAAGAAISGSELTIAAVEGTIGAAQAEQAQAFLCGTRTFGQPDTPSFFAYPRVQQIAPGVNCQNFGDRVTTFDQLSQLKAFWEGYYANQVQQVAGNDSQTRDKLTNGWFILQQQWALRWAESNYTQIRRELARQFAASPPQCTRPAAVQMQPASYSDPRTPQGHYVDRCYAYASQCDDNNADAKPSADAFCKSKGHSGVVPGGSQWSFKAPTQIQADGQLCNDPSGCGGLDWVSCQ